MAFDIATYIREADWELSEQNMTLGRSFSGSHQIVATGAPYWVASVKFKIRPADLSAYRAWKLRRRGSLVGDTQGPNKEWAGWPGVAIPFGDGATFGDGSSFATESLAKLSASAGASQIKIESLGSASTWAIGRFFSFGGWLYGITEIVAASIDTATVKFWPPLRESVTTGDAAEMPPRTLMRLSSDDVGRISDNYDQDLEVQLTLMEVLNR